MNTPLSVDLDVLGKLLSLAKSLDDAFRDDPKAKAIERVLIRTTQEGKLTFQMKGGQLWHFFTITLSGRENEYDLGKNFASIQSLFQALSGKTDSEIRRAAQGMAMYGETVIDTRDAVATLRSLEHTLNSLIDHIIAKKVRRQPDEERKKSIRQALEAMKIRFQPTQAQELIVKELKRVGKKRLGGDKSFEETVHALAAKIEAKKGYPYAGAYLQGRLTALERCKKELQLWQQGASSAANELAAFGSVKNLLAEWDRETPELTQLTQQAHDLRHSLQQALSSIEERILAAPEQDKFKKQLVAAGEKLSLQLQENKDELMGHFRQLGEHYLVQPQQYQLDLQGLRHGLLGKEKLIEEVEKMLAEPSREVAKKASSRKK